MQIQILKDEVVSQIAAGEVIERPASVVKELIENAIDANASVITVKILGAGKELIEVADDGNGIPFEELSLSVTRHATSKLSTAADLFSIHSLGFRGEALASIASVSQFEMISRHYQTDVAGRIMVDGGKTIALEKTGSSKGTVVRVRNLFYNVPARLKFLKTDSTERQRISNLVARFAMAYPFIRFQLFNENSPIFQTSGNGDHREILAQLYGPEIAKKMLVVKLEEESFKLNGYISPIAITRSNRREITFFVNGRWVQDASLSAALTKAYHTLIMVGRYPMSVLFLDIPFNQVDVNVHPTKAEVRFNHPDQIFSLVQRGVRRALLAYSSVPEVSHSVWSSNSQEEDSNQEFLWRSAVWTQDQGQNQASDSEVDGNIAQPQAGNPEAKDRSDTITFPLLRLVGQIGAAYLVAEGPDGLYLIDQHAAHERVLFEKMMSQLNKEIPSQSLLSPEVIHLPPNHIQIVEENLPVLRKLGFVIENFGPNSFQIRAIPQLLIGMDPISAVNVLVDDFEDDESPLQGKIEEKIAARVCKRAAVKAGQLLTKEEQSALLANLENCHSPRTCPHGRPTMIHLSVGLLEKQFGRKGSL